MFLMAREAKWRLLVGAAPVVGVVVFACAAVQGGADVARSPAVRVALAVIAACGAAVAWWTARQRRAASPVAVTAAAALARAGRLDGPVVLRGRARALPDAVPLVSPDGELCLWFQQDASVRGSAAGRSVRPFILADASGECLVLPAGAEVTGRGAVSIAAARSGRAQLPESADPQAGERLLRSGDRIRVTGRFLAASTQALALQAGAAAQVARSESAQAQLRSGDPPPLRDLRSAALAGAPFVAAPPLTPHALALPVISAAGDAQPLTIHIGREGGAGAFYGALAMVDGLVLVFASSLVACSMLLPG
jgi:hypothetical protein